MRIVEFKPLENTDGRVTAYLHSPIMEMENNRRDKYPSVVICPGGAYAFTSDREADPVAFEYLHAGYNVFILRYSVGENASNFTPLKELSATLMYIRDNAEDLSCLQEIAVCGFSAGGHLAASLCCMWNNPELLKQFDNKGGKNKPNGAILCYPVISAGEFAHEMSICNVSGSKKGEELYNYFSLENRVTEESCPAFLWHTVEDDGVPVENSLLFAMALRRSKVPFECHIFPTGGHGISVCTKESGTPHTHNRQWVDLSINWLNTLFSYEL